MNKYLTSKYLILLIIAPSILYFEFIHDVEPKDAISYYKNIEHIPDKENAAFALAGIAAPLDVKDHHKWGFNEVSKNLERYLAGKNEVKILNDSPNSSDDRLYINIKNSKEHFVCWLPSSKWEGKDKRCMDKKSIQQIINDNRELLNRYKELFNYKFYTDEIYFNEGLNHSITLSKLMVIDFWLKKDELSIDDKNTIFKLFRFWQRVVLNGDMGFVGLATSIVNYGLVKSLIKSLSQIKPEILSEYTELYGDFNVTKATPEFVNKINKAELKIMNSGFCFIAYENRNTYCINTESHSTFKKGRTLNLIYENKFQYDSCFGYKRDPFKEADRGLPWYSYFIRPGNFRGRAIADLAQIDKGVLCDVLKNIDIKAEENGFWNLYVYLKRKKYIAEQVNIEFINNKSLFSILDTKELYHWDKDNRLLVWQSTEYDNIKSELKY